MKLLTMFGAMSVSVGLLAGTVVGVAQADTTTCPVVMGDPIYQVTKPKDGSTLFTPWESEANSAFQAGYTDNRKTAFLASTSPRPGLIGVTRLYKRLTNDFLFTTSANEVSSAVGQYGYTNQGVSFYVSGAASGCTGEAPRFTKGAQHRLASTTADETALTADGWQREWVKLNVTKIPTTPTSSPTAPGPGTESGGTAPSPSASPTTPGKPSASTTGVPAGVALTQHYGNITVREDNTVLDGLDIHGFVSVRAKNVRITRSIVRGGNATSSMGLITTVPGADGLVIEDVKLQPEYPSVYIDGIIASNFVARRVHVVGGVDSVKIIGDNVLVQDSLLENTQYFANDPAQGGGATHNDNVQVLQGTNLALTGNTIRGAQNFAVLGAANSGSTGLLLRDNFVDGGYCTVKLEVFNGYALTATATGNKFGPNRTVASCAFQAQPAVNLTASANTYEATGEPVTILRK